MSHSPRKRFGQNFLHDHTIIQHILASVDAKTGQHLVEIGPGLGALTQPLLKENIDLDVVELDRDLVALLTAKFKDQPCIRIHSADALRFDFSALVRNQEKLRIIGNLPYNISTPLLFHLLDNAQIIDDMHFMLQKEVVDRICAGPGSKKYGRLSVMLQYYCSAEHLFDVGPESFDPPPQVTSAVVRIVPHEHAPVQVDNLNHFRQLVTQAFSQRRKTLRNALKKAISEQDISNLAIDPGLRAEDIALSEFASLSNWLCQQEQQSL